MPLAEEATTAPARASTAPASAGAVSFSQSRLAESLEGHYPQRSSLAPFVDGGPEVAIDRGPVVVDPGGCEVMGEDAVLEHPAVLGVGLQPAIPVEVIVPGVDLCTPSATTARTSSSLVKPCPASATARAGLANRIGPVRLNAGIRIATGPVITLCGPAYSKAATCRCSAAIRPVAVRYTPGSSFCHFPPALHHVFTVLCGIPISSACVRLITWCCAVRMRWSARCGPQRQ